jgi:hypothetical protein
MYIYARRLYVSYHKWKIAVLQLTAVSVRRSCSLLSTKQFVLNTSVPPPLTPSLFMTSNVVANRAVKKAERSFEVGWCRRKGGVERPICRCLTNYIIIPSRISFNFRYL